MEDDFLSRRNLYDVDDEDVGTALDGFSKFLKLVIECFSFTLCILETTKNVCRYFNRNRECYRGDGCPFLHLEQGKRSIVDKWVYYPPCTLAQ